MSNSVLFLFSSNAEALYAQDAVNVVAFPRGTVAHYRYDKRWVDPLVWTAIEEAQKKPAARPLEGTKVLCVFLDRSIHSGLPLIIPTRFGQIVSCEARGSVLHCYFSLEGFYDWNHATRKLENLAENSEITDDHRRNAIKAHHNQFYLWLGDYTDDKQEKKPRMPLSLFAVRATADDLKRSNNDLVRECPANEDKHAWENLIKTLHLLPYFGDTVFFRMSGLQMVGRPELGRWAWVPKFPRDWAKAKKRTGISIRALMPNVYGYRFDRVAPYELAIDIYQGRNLSARMKQVAITLSFEASQFFRSIEKVPILAKFDNIKIVLFPVFGSLDGPSHMAVRVVDETKTGSAAPAACVDVMALSTAPTDTPTVIIGGYTWYTPTELAAFKATLAQRRAAGQKADLHPHMAIVGEAPRGPQLTLPVESVHSMHYLMVGGFWAFLGFTCHLLATDQVLQGISSLVPDWILQKPYVTMWGASALLRVTGAWLIFRAFVYATRKLPTSGIK